MIPPPPPQQNAREGSALLPLTSYTPFSKMKRAERKLTQYPEFGAASKEIMLFYDNGFVLSRFASGCN